MSSIKKAKNGTYRVRVYVGRDEAGKPRYVERSARTQDDAKRIAAELEYQARTGAAPQRRQYRTWGDLLDAWWARASHNLAEATARTEANIIKRMWRDIDDEPLERITTAFLDHRYAELRAKGYSPAYIARVHSIASRALRQAVRWGWLATNPATNVELPRGVAVEPVAAEVDDLGRLVAHLDGNDPLLATFLRLGSVTGCRSGELCALRWRDVDLAEGAVTVRAVVGRGAKAGNVVRESTKTGRTRRIAIDQATVALLQRHRQHQREALFAAGKRQTETTWLFLGPDGMPWNPSLVNARVRRARKAAGADSVNIRALRHMNATHLIAAGVDPVTVARRLGHDPAMTLGRYAHVLPAVDRAAAERMASIVAAGA